MPYSAPLFSRPVPAKPAEALLELLLGHVIDIPTARIYYDNYSFFEIDRVQIEQLHRGKWVASANGSLIVEDTEDALLQALHLIPNGNRAYLEHVGENV